MLAQDSQQFIYTPRYKPNQLICGNGQVAVVTGWTHRKTVAKKLDPSEYAVIGNLYSPTRGISPLLRNLLANPHVYYLVILDATKEDKNAGGCQALLDFFENGFQKKVSDTGKPCWIIDSEITGYIDAGIKIEGLNQLWDNIRCFSCQSIEQCVETVKRVAMGPKLSGRKKPVIYPDPVISPPTILPGQRYGHRIEGKTIAETWVKILHRIKTTGTLRPTGYDGQWQELIDLVAVITEEPEGVYFPEPNYLPIDRDYLTEYIPQILDDAHYKEGIKYTYGQRLRSWFGRDQIEQVIAKLVNEIDAASAVMSLWDSGSGGVYYETTDAKIRFPCRGAERFGRGENDSDHDHTGSPCLNHIWVRIVDGELSLTATLRSNDMFAAWPANAMGLRTLQRHIRDEIVKRSDYDLTMGPLITVSQSAHIYDDTWENVDILLKTQYPKLVKQRDYSDPSGNFLIEIESEQIVVKQTTPGSGEEVATYSGKNPLKLIREICAASPAIHPDHIGYLGIELERAKQAIKTNQQYTQDKTC